MSISQRNGGLSAHSQRTSSPPGTTSAWHPAHNTPHCLCYFFSPFLAGHLSLRWPCLRQGRTGGGMDHMSCPHLVWYRKPKGKCKRDMSTVRRQAILCSSSSVILFDVIYYFAVGKQSQGYVDRHRRSQLSSNNSLKNSSVFETIQISSVAGYPKEHTVMLRSLRTE